MKSKLFGNKPLLHTHTPQQASQHTPQHAPQHTPQQAPQHTPQQAPQHTPQQAPQHTHPPTHPPASTPQQGTTPQRHIHPALLCTPLLLPQGHRLPEHWQADIKAAVSEGLSESQAHWKAKSDREALKVD